MPGLKFLDERWIDRLRLGSNPRGSFIEAEEQSAFLGAGLCQKLQSQSGFAGTGGTNQHGRRARGIAAAEHRIEARIAGQRRLRSPLRSAAGLVSVSNLG